MALKAGVPVHDGEARGVAKTIINVPSRLKRFGTSTSTASAIDKGKRKVPKNLGSVAQAAPTSVQNKGKAAQEADPSSTAVVPDTSLAALQELTAAV